jgi:hypothetical protein
MVGVVEAGARVVEAAVVVVGTKTPTTAGKPLRPHKWLWQGGREGYCLHEDEYVPLRSWHYHQSLKPHCACQDVEDPPFWGCPNCKDAIVPYLHLYVAGTSKGRCKARRAWATITLSHEKGEGSLYGPVLKLGETTVESVKQAKEWGVSLGTPDALKLFLQLYYGTLERRGKLLVKQDPSVAPGWLDWLWTFEEHPHWGDLLHYGQSILAEDRLGGTSIYTGTGSGWTCTSFKTRWDLLRMEKDFLEEWRLQPYSHPSYRPQDEPTSGKTKWDHLSDESPP